MPTSRNKWSVDQSLGTELMFSCNLEEQLFLVEILGLVYLHVFACVRCFVKVRRCWYFCSVWPTCRITFLQRLHIITRCAISDWLYSLTSFHFRHDKHTIVNTLASLKNGSALFWFSWCLFKRICFLMPY